MAVEDEELPTHGEDETEVDDQDEGSEDGDEGDEDSDTGEDGDDEGEEAEGSGREARGEVEDKPRKRGASDVIRENKKRAKESESREAAATLRAEAAERRAEAAERAANDRRQTESAEARANRLAQMSPEERFDALRAEDRQSFSAEINSLKFQGWDQSDSAKFDRLVDRDPLVARVADKVEAEYQKLSAQGRPVSREILADIQVGKMMRANQKTAGTKQRKKAAEGVKRETVQPRRASGDAPASRGRRGQEDTPEARRKRLEGVFL